MTFKGGGLTGVRRLLVSGGDGVTAQFTGGGNAVDETARPVFQSKCTSCHEARSPDNRSMTGDQWAATVSRMITQHGADINNTDRDKIVGYLQGLAKAGEITAKIMVAANAAPGLREVRLLTTRGVSSATAFEVGNIPEMNVPSAATGKPEEAPVVTLPIVINGIVAQPGERDNFRFDARKGEHLTFNLKAERLNEEEATYFFPTLYLYDLNGKELAKSLGKEGIDPVITFTVPVDGGYRLVVRDLLYHGTPGSVYRLAMGELPADGVLSPGWARPGEIFTARVVPVTGDSGGAPAAAPVSFSLHAPTEVDGMTTVATPAGATPLLVRDLPDGGGPGGLNGTPVTLPALFRGEIARPGQTDTFHVHAERGGTAIEVYAQRLGSPLMPSVTVKDATGNVVFQRAASGDDDLRLPGAFPKAGDYTVEITDADGNGGAGYFYCYEASAGVPELQLSVTPDVANITPGTSMTLMVRAVRRQSVSNAITVRARNLPPGITATDAVLLPGMNEAALVLTAALTASAGVGGFLSIEGQASADAAPASRTPGAPPTSIRRLASPIEIFALGNQTIHIPRATAAVAIRSDPPAFTIALADGGTSLAVTPGQDLKILVNIQRENGFKGTLFLAAQGLPPGITAAQATVNVPVEKSDAVIVLHVAKEYASPKATGGAAPIIPNFAIAGFLATLNNDYIANVTTGPISITSTTP